MVKTDNLILILVSSIILAIVLVFKYLLVNNPYKKSTKRIKVYKNEK